MNMPECSGRECFDALRKIFPYVNAGFSSGYSLTPEIQELIDDGFMEFI